MFKKIWDFLTKPAYPAKKYVVLTADDGTKIYIEASGGSRNIFIHRPRMDMEEGLNRALAQQPDVTSYIKEHQNKGLGEKS